MKTQTFMLAGAVILLFVVLLNINDLGAAPNNTAKKKEDKRRGISTAEYQFALALFEREFPPRDILTITNETGFNGRPYVRPTIDGHIRINFGSHYDDVLGTAANRELFAHELTHAWQLEHFGKVWYGKQAVVNQVISGDSYDYTCDPDKKLSDYNAEQQGEIVKDYYKKNACATSITRSLRSTTWKLLIGSDAVDIAVDAAGVYYMVNTSGNIYRYTGDDWEQLSGSAGKAIAGNGGQVCLINSEGKIYQLLGTAWTQMPGSNGRDIAIDADGTVWLVNTEGKIYKYNGSSWNQMPGSNGARIAAGGGQVWLVNTAGKIYKFNGTAWKQTTGSAGKDITVSNDGKVFLTNRTGSIYERTGRSWLKLAGYNGSTLSANGNKLVLVNIKGRMFFRAY
jgi:Tectonin domain